MLPPHQASISTRIVVKDRPEVGGAFYLAPIFSQRETSEQSLSSVNSDICLADSRLGTKWSQHNSLWSLYNRVHDRIISWCCTIVAAIYDGYFSQSLMENSVVFSKLPSVLTLFSISVIELSILINSLRL